MIDFKSFIYSLHGAIADASDIIAERNRAAIDRYFNAVSGNSGEVVYSPKMVTMSLPMTDADGKITDHQIQVPLVALVPFSGSQVEKTTLTADVSLSIENNELQMDFGHHNSNGSAIGKLEIVISPSQPVEGMEKLVDAYTELLSKQL